MFNKYMVGLLNRAMFRMVLLVPIWNLDGLWTVGRSDDLSFQVLSYLQNDLNFLVHF